MTIDRVIFCWDGNPIYDGMYQLQRRLWAKLGIKTTLFIVGAPDIDLPDSIHLETAPELPQDPPGGRNWKATMALLHGPRCFPGEVIMTSGVDQFPLSRHFIDAVASHEDDEFVIGFAGVGGEYDTSKFGCRYYPSSHLVAKSKMWDRVMAPAPKDFPELLRWAFHSQWPVMWPDYAYKWGMDEAVFSQLMAISDVTPTPLSKEFFDDWNDRRFGRGFGRGKKRPFLWEAMAAGEYAEFCSQRPLPESERDLIKRVIELL